MKLFKISLHVLVLAAATACSGNDANKCKVATLEGGDVRVSCPGQPALILPSGNDGSAGVIECEMQFDSVTSRDILTCDGQTVALRGCIGGVEGDLFLGTNEEHERFSSVDFSKSEETVRFVQQNECEHVRGTVYLTASSATLYADVLERLIYADEVVILEEVGETRLPNLKAAQITFMDAVNSISSVKTPILEDGSISILGGQVDGSLVLENFETGVMTVANVEGLRELRLPKFTVGDLYVSDQSNLEVIDTPLLRFTEDFVFEHLPSLKEVNAPSLEYVGRVRLADLTALETVDLSGLVRVRGNLEFHRFGSVQSLLFPNLESAQVFTIESNPSLRVVRAEKLAQIATNIAIDTNGTASSPPLDIILPALISARSASFSNAKLRKLDLTSFTGITDKPVSLPAANLILSSSVLEELILPNLRNTGLYVTLNAATTTPTFMDLSNFYFDAVNGTDTLNGNAMRILGAFANEVVIKMDNAFSSWQVEIDGVRFAEIFKPGPNFSGAFWLKNISTGSMVDLTDNLVFRRVLMTNVGSVSDPYFLRLLSPTLTQLEVEGGHMNGAEIASADNATLRFDGTGDSHFEGDISLLGTTQAETARNLRLFGAPTYSVGEILVGTISSGEITRLQLELYVSSVESLHLGSVENLSIVGTTTEVSYLDISSIQTLAASSPLDLRSLPIEGLVLNPVPQPGIIGTIRAEWSGLPCPNDLFALLPNVTFNTGCSSP